MYLKMTYYLAVICVMEMLILNFRVDSVKTNPTLTSGSKKPDWVIPSDSPSQELTSISSLARQHKASAADLGSQIQSPVDCILGSDRQRAYKVPLVREMERKEMEQNERFYEFQLKALEEQNKLRLKMAKQEQQLNNMKAMASIGGSSTPL
jgi:hypothetical protein